MASSIRTVQRRSMCVTGDKSEVRTVWWSEIAKAVNWNFPVHLVRWWTNLLFNAVEASGRLLVFAAERDGARYGIPSKNSEQRTGWKNSSPQSMLLWKTCGCTFHTYCSADGSSSPSTLISMWGRAIQGAFQVGCTRPNLPGVFNLSFLIEKLSLLMH